MDISRASSDKLLLKYAMKNDKKEEIFHSSGYARAQAGANFGAAGGESMDVRNKIDEQRKYVQGYKNSRITNEYLGVQRAKARAATAISKINNRSDAGTSNTANPMDVAMARAKQTASGPGAPSAGLRGKMSAVPRPSLGASRAPSIPSRRSGI